MYKVNLGHLYDRGRGQEMKGREGREGEERAGEGKKKKEQPKSNQASRSGFLSLVTIDIWDPIILWLGAAICIVQCLFSSIQAPAY